MQAAETKFFAVTALGIDGRPHPVTGRGREGWYLEHAPTKGEEGGCFSGRPGTGRGGVGDRWGRGRRGASARAPNWVTPRSIDGGGAPPVVGKRDHRPLPGVVCSQTMGHVPWAVVCIADVTDYRCIGAPSTHPPTPYIPPHRMFPLFHPPLPGILARTE